MWGAPQGLGGQPQRAEKAAFKRVVRNMIEAGIEVNSAKTDAICDW